MCPKTLHKVITMDSICHTSHVTCHTSHVTRHMSHVTHHMSHVTCHTSHVTCHTSHVTHHMSHITRHMSHVTCHTLHVTCHTSHVLAYVICMCTCTLGLDQLCSIFYLLFFMIILKICFQPIQSLCWTGDEATIPNCIGLNKPHH